MSKKRIFNLACYLIACLLIFLSYQLYQGLFRPMTLPAPDVIYEYPKGMSVKMMSRDLQKKGFIRSAPLFEWYIRLTGSDKHMHAGEYEVYSGMSPNALMIKMRKGEIFMHSLRVPEGGTVRELIEAIKSDPSIQRTQPFDDNVLTKMEGLLMPETYFFPKGESDVDIIKRAHEDAMHYATKIFEERDPAVPFKNVYETLIVASILEKEAAIPEERTKIARVIINRLKLGMPLQMDPTVIYGMGESYKGKLTKKNLQTPGPYNSYLNTGLPPTPICFPSKNAVWSAVHPVDGKYLYFVSQGDGSHVFSETLDAHNKAVVRYVNRVKKETKP